MTNGLFWISMIFSKAFNYGLQSLVYMHKHHPQEYFSVGELSAGLNCSKSYLSKILRVLVDARILRSETGPGKGYIFQKNMAKVKVADILSIFDEDDKLDSCLLGWADCSDHNPCPYHDRFMGFKQNLRKDFKNKTVTQISAHSWPDLGQQI